MPDTHELIARIKDQMTRPRYVAEQLPCTSIVDRDDLLRLVELARQGME